MQSKELSIGQVARRTGLAVSAIRYYETEGLIQANRNAGGQRRFHKGEIRRISFIMVAQKFGFSIARIRNMFQSFPPAQTPSEDDWLNASQAFKAELDAQIAALESLRDKLDGCIGCGCLSMKKCALYNPEDKVAENGTGPQLL